MSVTSRIRRLERQANKIKHQSKPLFFNSMDEYKAALSNGIIKDYHICFIDDVPNE